MSIWTNRIFLSGTPFDLTAVIKGWSTISITVVLVILDMVARAGTASVMDGSIRNRILPVPDGGKSFSWRLRKSMSRRPLQKTGMLIPATDREEKKLSTEVSFLIAEINPKNKPAGIAIIMALNASFKVFGNFKSRSSNTSLFV